MGLPVNWWRRFVAWWRAPYRPSCHEATDDRGFLPGEREDPEGYRSYYAGDADTGRY